MDTETSPDGVNRQEHWNSAYEAKGTTGVSWYQSTPTTSLAILESLGVKRNAGLIDIGGGASSLTASLLERGFTDLSVLDVSDRAMLLSQEHLGSLASGVTWIHEDLLSWTPSRTYDVWHDRAVFHFLVEPRDRQRYVEILLTGLVPDGVAVLGTFAPDGPPQCSGLPVARYDAATLGAVLGTGFVVLDEQREEHHTPMGVVQPFTWTTLQRQNVGAAFG